MQTEDDYFNYGVNMTDISVPINTDLQIQIKETEIINPLFVGVEQQGGSANKLTLSEIYLQYSHVYVICMADNFIQNPNIFKIYDRVVDKNEFYDLFTSQNTFKLLQCSNKLMMNEIYKKNANIVDKIHLTKMFDKIIFQDTEIIIPLYELTETIAKINISLYDKPFEIENLNQLLSITSYYNTYKKPIIEQLSNYLTNMTEAQFWCDSRNCLINMTDTFSGRGFGNTENTTDDKTIYSKSSLEKNKQKQKQELEQELEQQDKQDNKNIFKKKHEDYDKVFDAKTSFVDIYSALGCSGKRTYYAPNNINTLKVSKETITDLICSIDNEEELYNVFNAVLVSKDYCHMVLNNSKVLDKVQNLLTKYKILYKYLFGYAWLCLSIEESIFKTKSTKTSRFVFDIETASKLPIFPYSYDDITQNPYISILVDKKIVDIQNNCLSLQQIENFDGYGVCNLEQFTKRFNLFTTGYANKQLLNGIDWTKFAVSGSVIPACLQKQSPLLNLVASKNLAEDDKWLIFFNNYYNDSDIDLMCNVPTIHNFIDEFNNVINAIKLNMNLQQEDITVEPIKSVLFTITKDYFITNQEKIRTQLCNTWQVDDMILNKDSTDIKEFLYMEYLQYKQKNNIAFRKNKSDTNIYMKKFMEQINISDMNVHLISVLTGQETKVSKTSTILDSEKCFYINDLVSDKVSDDKNILIYKISENIRFKIKSHKIPRSIEVFRSKTQDFFGLVGKFHLPCVRAYYQNNNVYILPSCITAMHTGINIEYKYFAGIRNPIDIINKYRMRGFSIILTEKEKKYMQYFNSHNKKIGEMFYHSSNSNENLFNAKELTDDIFKPLTFTKGYPIDTYNKVDVKYIKNIDDIKRIYKYNSEGQVLNMFNLKYISDSGYIIPYQSWITKAYYNLLQMSIKTQDNNVVIQRQVNMDKKEKLVKKIKNYKNKKY